MAAINRPKPIAGTIGLVFGGLWGLLSAMALPPDWRLPTALLAGLVTVTLAIRLWRAGEAAGDGGLFRRRAYLIAVMLEIVALYAASAILPGLGWQGYFIQVVGFIVGLHFIGLWIASGSGRFVGIAIGMCVVSAAAMILPGARNLLNLRDAATGLGNALILWLGASRSASGKPPPAFRAP